MSIETAALSAADRSARDESRLTAGTPLITCIQFLDEKGRTVKEHTPDLESEDLLRLYHAMVLARAADERMLKLQRQGRIGTFPLCAGQEAAACAPVLAMKEDDWFVGSFRESGGRLLRGEPLENQLLYYGGYEEGNTFAGGERTLPISVIVAGQALHAVGIGYAIQVQGEKDAAVVCFLGDGATSQGDFHEALNFASVWQSPVVFVCVNNQWAISVPREKQTRSRTLAQKAYAYEIPGIQVDGNDPLAMYQVTKEALDRARAGEGPTFIEAITYRLKMHTTADDPTRYRSDTERATWEKREPLLRFRKYLSAKGIWNDDLQADLEVEIAERINEAVTRFEGMTEFKPDAPFDHVFGTPHSRTEQQRAEFLRNMEREAPDG